MAARTWEGLPPETRAGNLVARAERLLEKAELLKECGCKAWARAVAKDAAMDLKLAESLILGDLGREEAADLFRVLAESVEAPRGADESGEFEPLSPKEIA